MNRAIPMAIGTPMATAITEATTVPNRIAAMPKIGGSACGNQTCVVSRFPELPENAGSDFQIRKIAMAAITTRSSPPAPAERPLNTRSPVRVCFPLIEPRTSGDSRTG